MIKEYLEMFGRDISDIDEEEEDMIESQISVKYANKKMFDLLHTYINLNKIHCAQLGILAGAGFGALMGILPLPYNVIIALFMADLIVLSAGISIMSIFFTRVYPPNYGFIYTVRTDPWWFLSFLIPTFLLFVSVFTAMFS